MAEISYREALNQALREEMERDERVFIMGEQVGYLGGPFKVTDGLLAVYGERRVRDAPISELATVGAGIGAAIAGLRPVVELSMNAALLAIDQIVNHAAKFRYMSGGQAMPLVIRIPQGAGPQLEHNPVWSCISFIVRGSASSFPLLPPMRRVCSKPHYGKKIRSSSLSISRSTI